MQCRKPRSDPWVGKIPCKRKWQLTPVFLPGKLHGQRSLAGYKPWGCEQSETMEWLTHLVKQMTYVIPSFCCFTSKMGGLKYWLPIVTSSFRAVQTMDKQEMPSRSVGPGSQNCVYFFFFAVMFSWYLEWCVIFSRLLLLPGNIC